MATVLEGLIAEIHASPVQVAIAVSGGGGRAIAQLLEVPGASRTVLEAAVPYSAAAMTEWLGGPPDQYCSAQTARAMAMAAFHRARRFAATEAAVAGLACTASLATDRLKRGSHRAHLALQTAELTVGKSLRLEKGRRSRAEEERLVAGMLINLVAEACGVQRQLPVDFLPGETVESSGTVAPKSWQDLLLGRVARVRQGGPTEPAAEPCRVVFPGAFNPIHEGHRRMARLAADLLRRAIEFEISILNVDKPPLDYLEIERRLSQFGPHQVVWLTRSASFEEKSRQFPQATFIVGTDTVLRIADCRYYGDDPTARRASLEAIAAAGCRFLVFGRSGPDGFVTLSDLDLPEPLKSLCQEVPGDQFRHDVSSSKIRASEE